MSPLVSIIVPVYNSDEYLSQCIDSILHQTYKNLEIILVDDGSTDSSSFICDAYCRQDSRVHVIHEENRGLVSARKKGLAYSTGDYIMPVDSDDWIDARRVEDMLQIALQYKCEIVQSGLCIEGDDNVKSIADGVIAQGYYDLKSRSCVLWRNLFMSEKNPSSRGMQSSLCSCLFVREIIFDVQMTVSEDIHNGEDDVCFFPCVLSGKSFYKMESPSYHYRRHPGSMTKSKNYYSIDEVLKMEQMIRPYVESHIAKDVLVPQFERYILIRLNYHVMMKWNIGYRPNYVLPYKYMPKEGRVVIYGAGIVGRSYVAQLADDSRYCISGWLDQRKGYRFHGYCVVDVQQVKNLTYDFILIAAIKISTVKSMIVNLRKYGISIKGVYWRKPIRSLMTGFLDINLYLNP